jgi:5'-3' exonuclease
MGIRGLNSLIEKYNTTDNEKIKSIFTTSLSFIKGKTVCIDISPFIHCSTIRDKKGYLSGILNLINKLRIYNIKPLIVFDGKPPIEKKKVTEQRTKQRQKFRKISQSIEEKQINNSKILNKLHKFKYTSNDLDSENELDSGVESLEASLSELKIEELNIQYNISSIYLTRENINDINKYLSLNHDNIYKDFIKFYKIFYNEIELFKDIELNLTKLNDLDYINQLICQFSKLDKDLADKQKKAQNKSSSMTSNMIKDIKVFLDMLKIPYIHPEIEADIICAYLVKSKQIDYCISNDMDMLAYGCPKVIRNLNFKNDKIDIYSLNNILFNFKMSHDKLIELCILLGCEYTSRIIGINNELAFTLIQKYDTIDNILTNIDEINENYKRLCIPINFNHQKAKKLFTIDQDFRFNKSEFDTMIRYFKNLNKDKSTINTIRQYCIDKMPNIKKYMINKQLYNIICV